jgi:hypothetical protein
MMPAPTTPNRVTAAGYTGEASGVDLAAVDTDAGRAASLDSRRPATALADRALRSTSTHIASGRLAATFVIALALVSLNMRTVLASVPPLLGQIRADLGLSAAVAGLLTTVPVLCFGLFAPLVPVLVRTVAIERIIAITLGLTALGAAARGLLALFARLGRRGPRG